MKTFKQHIQESAKEECGILYGKKLFDEIFGGKEKDTQEEKNLVRLLNTYMKIENKSTRKAIKPYLNRLAKCKTIFKKELNSRKRNKNMFRGLTTIEQKLLDKLSVEKISNRKYKLLGYDRLGYNQKKGKKVNYVFIKDTYTPRSNVESWSDTSKSAFFYGPQILSVYVAPMKHDEVIFDGRFLEKVLKHSTINQNMLVPIIDEHEIIRISKTPIDCDVLIRISSYDVEQYIRSLIGEKYTGTLEYTYEKNGEVILTVGKNRNMDWLLE